MNLAMSSLANAKSSLIPVLLPKDRAEAESIPGIPQEDLYLCAGFLREGPESTRNGGDPWTMTRPVLAADLRTWSCSLESAVLAALENGEQRFPARFETLEDVLDIPAECRDGVLETIFVLSNSAWAFGSSALFYQREMEKASEKLGGDYYVIPSSVHELLLIPGNGNLSAEDLLSVHHEVMVRDRDFLSDGIYFYKAGSAVLHRVG